MAQPKNKETDLTELRRKAELLTERSKSREEAEFARQKFEQLYCQFANLFDSAPIGYLTIDQAGVIREINLTAAISFNAPKNSLTGRRISDFIHMDDQDSFCLQIRNCRKNLNIARFEVKLKRADGFFFNAHLQMQTIFNLDGEDPIYSIALTDVSEQVQLSTSFTLQQECLNTSIQATNMNALLNGYVRVIKSYLECEAVGIRILDDAGNIPYQAYDGFSQAFYDSESPLSLHTDQCMCISVIKGDIDHSKPFITKRGSFFINGTSRFLATVPPKALGKTRNVCNAHGYESVALVPIFVDNTIEGLIHAADCRENRFPVRVVESIEDVAARLGLSLQRFYLLEKLQDSLCLQKDLSSHLMTVQEEEQRRIAMELHDGLGQDLNVMKLHLKVLQNQLPAEATDGKLTCDRLMTCTDKIINDIRNIAYNLMPAELDVLGLAGATRQMIREFLASTTIQMETHIELLDQIKVSMVQVCLFRIFQEALTNIHKHAEATWVVIAANCDGKNMRIRIKDNGIGFDTRNRSTGANGRMGMGLSAIELRCRMIGADFSIDSEAGKGTRLTICLPCPNVKASR